MHGERAVKMTRVFNAPRPLVWEAFNKPELMQRWFGPRGYTMPVCEMDARPGGTFKFVLRGPDGREMVMRGTYREIAPPERSVHVESYDDFPGESVVTAVFTEAEGKTTLTAIVEYPSQMVRDNVVPHMEHGAAESYDKLAELLAEQAASA
jgi:uncharacterized protein YndB with AHSA1/START domain